MNSTRKIKFYTEFKKLILMENRYINDKLVEGYIINGNKLDLFIESDSPIGAYIKYARNYKEFDKLIDLSF